MKLAANLSLLYPGLSLPEQRHEPDLTDPAVQAALCSLKSAGYQGWLGCEYRPEADTSAGLTWRASYHALLED
ncbi:hypothetical protein H0A65_14835 [Alcaligenaceae bacterium]|nr:hypothetical protein [Alcaligenaceae bacterium]